MKRATSNLHLTNTLRTRAAVFGAGVSVLRVSVAVSVSSAVSGFNTNTAASAICSFLTAVPMVWGTSVSRYVMT